VNLIAVGFVDTPLSATLLGDGLEARREELHATLPIARVVGPADIAAAVALLMSDDATWITAQVISVDGGSTVRP
jgi:NAD(P)-dependent dehydrogenase (short-subunit alcohol dehydrogenase family)